MTQPKIQRIEPTGAFSQLGGQRQDEEINRMRRVLNSVADELNVIISSSSSGSVVPPPSGGIGIVNTSGVSIQPGTVVGYNSSGAMAFANATYASYVAPIYIVQTLTTNGQKFYPNTGVPLYVRVTGSWSIGGVAWLSTTSGTVQATRPATSCVQISVGVFADSVSSGGLALVRPQVGLVGGIG